MNILLINSNPVVSRLLALCTREEHMILEEVESMDSISQESYDLVFVDEGSYVGEVLNLFDILTIGKKIFLSNAEVKVNDFDMTIQKPFLPSQIIEILENVNEDDDILKEVEVIDAPSIFPLSTDTDILDESMDKIEDTDVSGTQVLDSHELDKIKGLLEMDDEIEVIEEGFSEEEIEKRKIEVIKEQLIAEGLEIVGEEDIMDELGVEDIVVFSAADEIGEKSKSKSEKKKSSKKKNKLRKNKNKKSLDFTEEDLERIEDAVEVAIATLKPKQMKKLLKGKEIEVSIKLEDVH